MRIWTLVALLDRNPAEAQVFGHESTMKIKLRRFVFAASLACAVLLPEQDVFGLGGDYFTNRFVGVNSEPTGFEQLVNATNRVAGYFLNSVTVFFFAGSAQDFSAFLDSYSRIHVAGTHEVILHNDVGEAKSPWSKTGRPCDWELYACRKGILDAHVLLNQHTNSVAAVQAAAKDTNYVLVVNFWTGGRIAMSEVQVPPNVEVKKAD